MAVAFNEVLFQSDQIHMESP